MNRTPKRSWTMCALRGVRVHDPRKSIKVLGSLPGARRASPRAHNVSRSAAKGTMASMNGVRE